jgi:hypothetical protein
MYFLSLFLGKSNNKLDKIKVTVANMTENLVNSLVTLSSKAPLEFIKDTSKGIISSLGNSLGVNIS